MVNLPVKPQFLVRGTRVLVFMGSDYKDMDVQTADTFCRGFQGAVAKAKRNEKKLNRGSRACKSNTLVRCANTSTDSPETTMSPAAAAAARSTP